jgi:ATP adenylyltransferase
VTGTPSTAQCIFCDAGRAADAAPQGEAGPSGDAAGPAAAMDHAELVVARGRTCYVILNRYPYNNGHLMVVPNRHLGSLATLSAEELSELMLLTRDSEVALAEAYQPQGINVGINIGRPAGAGIVDHVHVHLVPRWTGDTNFISVIGETRVLPEALGDTARRLRPIFAKLLADRPDA